jgi:ribose/xylose/arabinose/galactoside ABC-type transport system permease subunit
VALAVLQVISSSFNQLNVNPYLTYAIWGLLLIGAGSLALPRSRAVRQ